MWVVFFLRACWHAETHLVCRGWGRMERKEREKEKASKRSSMRLHSFGRLAAQVTEAERRSGDAVLQLHQAGIHKHITPACHAVRTNIRLKSVVENKMERESAFFNGNQQYFILVGPIWLIGWQIHSGRFLRRTSYVMLQLTYIRPIKKEINV